MTIRTYASPEAFKQALEEMHSRILVHRVRSGPPARSDTARCVIDAPPPCPDIRISTQQIPMRRAS